MPPLRENKRAALKRIRRAGSHVVRRALCSVSTAPRPERTIDGRSRKFRALSWTKIPQHHRTHMCIFNKGVTRHNNWTSWFSAHRRPKNERYTDIHTHDIQSAPPPARLNISYEITTAQTPNNPSSILHGMSLLFACFFFRPSYGKSTIETNKTFQVSIISTVLDTSWRKTLTYESHLSRPSVYFLHK